MASSSEAKELDLVGKVELRIALADSDPKLETLLRTYLAPLLLKLASEFVSVRNKVISVCQHINTRIKPPLIKLPVAALLKQFKENQNSLVRHFDILYIQTGFDRLPETERLELIPSLLSGLSKNFQESSKLTASLFNTFLRLLHKLKLPLRGSKDDEQLRSRFFQNTGTDAEFVASQIGKLFLFSSTSQLSLPPPSPGLNAEECDFLRQYGKPDTWSPSSGGLNLAETKVVSAKFLSSGAFEERERFLPALIASADISSRLSDVGDEILKKALPATSLEDKELVRLLFSLYLGSGGVAGSPPVKPALQGKILGLFCKSKYATTFTSEILKIAREGLSPNVGAFDTSSRPSKSGLEASKLRGQVFSFINWVTRIASPADIAEVAPELVGNLRAYIETQGWPKIGETASGLASELKSRSYGYECIGLLAKVCPDKLLLEPDLDLLRWLFRSLGGDNSGKEVSISIEQALSSVLGAYAHGCDSQVEESIIELLVHYATLGPGDQDASGTSIIRSTRYVAVRFTNRCLPYSNTRARWIDLLALSGGSSERNEVIEEGKKGLDPHWFRNLNPRDAIDSTGTSRSTDEIPFYRLPEFSQAVETFYRSKEETKRLGKANATAVSFCTTLLFHSALSTATSSPVVDADWQRNIEALRANDEASQEMIRRYLAEISNDSSTSFSSLQKLVDIAFTCLNSPEFDGCAEAGQCLLNVCSLAPQALLKSLAPRIQELNGTEFSNEHSTRLIAGQCFGLLGSPQIELTGSVYLMVKAFYAKAQDWEDAIGSKVHEIHGSLVSLAYWSSRSNKSRENQIDGVPSIGDLTRLSLSILGKSRDKDLIEAAVTCLDQLSIFGLLSPSMLPQDVKTSELIEKLENLSKGGDENAVLALGHFSMHFSISTDESSPLAVIIKTLYSLHEKRQAELQFAVGAALSCAASGWESKSLVETLGGRPRGSATSSRDGPLETILEKVLEDCKRTKPSLRQAAVIWLLCLVQFCGHLPYIQEQLRACQQAFKGFLSDRESLNQEAASKGLTLIYEKGNKAMKEDLIKDLVGAFTGSASNLSGSVDADTQLFEPGALPTGEGSVTTYKDIVNLASEVGDPSLVYRFMSLAQNSAIWSSRAAFGRFGLSNILSDASVDGYLAQNPKLYAALFRYRFDPNSNVRSAMSDIWAALVKNPKATVDTHFQHILQDLLKNIFAKEWRTRQACCAAIGDLLQGRPLSMYESNLTEIWTVTFKVCDDIKGTVRAAAMALARVLTGILVRSLERGEASASTANSILKEVLPFLLGSLGLGSSAKEVQVFALVTLLDIIKKANPTALRPYLSSLIGNLLALLSSIEPQEVNYLHLNADKYGVTEQQIDDARLSSVKTSPMMEAIEKCLDMLDSTSMKELDPALRDTAKTLIGLPSRVGLSRVLVTLSTRHNSVFRPYADGFLRLTRRQVLDRNDTIATSAASSCGYLARIASDKEVLGFVEYAKNLYFEAEDERHRTVAGELILAFAKYATDRFAAIASETLPFAFLGMHDSHEAARDLFKAAWEEQASGPRAVLLYLTEIISMASAQFDSPRWSVKHASALAIADTVRMAGSEISLSNAQLMWPALEKALGGKTWQGKEKVLEGLVRLANHSKLLEESPGIAEQVQRIMIREGKRNNVAYRHHAIVCLGEISAAFSSLDWFEKVFQIIEPTFDELVSDKDSMDVDDKDPSEASSKTLSEERLGSTTRALLACLTAATSSEARLGLPMSQCLAAIEAASKQESRIVQNAIYEGEKSLFEKFSGMQKLSEEIGEQLVSFSATLLPRESQTELTRVKAAEALAALSRVARSSSNKRLGEAVAQAIAATREGERSYSVQQYLDQAMMALRE